MSTEHPPQDPSPWHEGEIALQKSVGVAERMDAVGRRVLRDHLIEQHRMFYRQLPFVAMGAVDRQGDVWATLRAGHPGFLRSPDIHTLSIDIEREPADPADEGMDENDAIALIGIELHTRRRNRLNGTIARGRNSGFDLKVGHSYGNCPQYIQLRDFEFVREPSELTAEQAEHMERLDRKAREAILGADTFFVATYTDRDGERQVDVSHRGGKQGFVRVDEDGVLTIPDFAGNLFFNTLGNILVNGRAGLVFVDFETGELLQLTGDAEVILDSDEIAAFQGAERLWRFFPRQIVRRPDAMPLRWKFREDGWSPNSLLTGSWRDAGERLKAAAFGSSWRPFRVVDIVDESATIKSFYLEPNDKSGVIPHRPGQHLPIRVLPTGKEKPVTRTYTLSTAPSDGRYRITVKREGLVSNHLHKTVRIGDIIEARAPDGGFTIEASETRPAVMLAAGIGITPLLSMLRHIVYEGLRKRYTRPTWLFYATRTKDDRAFEKEIDRLVACGQAAIHLIRVLTDPRGAIAGTDYDRTGRIDIALLRETLAFDDYDFYLCGPSSFTQSIYDGLTGLNVADDRIHAEAFGPSTLVRRAPTVSKEVDQAAPADRPVSVQFLASAKETVWRPGSGTLLELAEEIGLSPEFSCRAGSCGSCRTKMAAGEATYTKPVSAPVSVGEVLLCCAVPAATTDPDATIQLDL